MNLPNRGAKLDAIYFCPHNSADNCVCRKPKTGLIKQALSDFEIDLKNSWMIGDKAIDIETGFNAGTKTALVLTGYGQKEIEKLEQRTGFSCEKFVRSGKIHNYKFVK